MSPSLFVSLATGFLVGMIVALVFSRILWERRGMAKNRISAERSSEAWATVLHHAVDELKTRQVDADSRR